MMAVVRRPLRCQGGTAAAEMALMLPLMVIILFGMFEGGHFLFSEHKVLKGVRDGARYAARANFNNYNCSTNAINSTLAGQVQKLTRTGYPDGDNPNVTGTDNPFVPGWTDAQVSVTMSCASGTNTGLYEDISGGAPRVTVTADVPYTSLFGVIGFNSSSLRLKAKAQAAVTGL